MAITLSNGYERPETGDFGSEFFPALERNIQRVNDHTHDGSNSERLTASSSQGITQTISSGDFASVSAGVFSAAVTLPVAIEVDTANIQFRDPVTKDSIYLRFERVSLTQITVFTNFVQDFELLVTT